MEQKPLASSSSPGAPSEAPPAIDAHVSRRSRGFKTFSSVQNNRDYRFLWAGNTFANCAQWIQVFTVGWLVLEISGGSALLSSTVIGVRSLPVLLMGPWAGALTDRWDRRKFAIGLQVWMAVAAVLFAAVVASGEVRVWHAFVYMVISGIGFTSMQPVRQSLIANTVAREDMGNAWGLHAMTANSMRLIGPLIGGVLIETVGFKWNFIVQAGLYIGMLLLLLPMRTPYREGSANRGVSMWSNMVEGMRYIWTNRALLQLNVVNLGRSIVLHPIAFFIPVYTQDVLNAHTGTGTMLITALGLGGLTSSVIVASWQFYTKRGMVSLISLAAGAVCILALSQSHWLWLSVIAIASVGFSQTYFVLSNTTSIQSIVPDFIRGRVTSVWLYADGLIPMWVFLIGLTAEFTGIATALTIVGGLALSAAVYFLLQFKEMRGIN